MRDDAPPPDQPAAFATTQWSLVLAAGELGNADSRDALEQLCATYWPPLYAYALRRVADTHEAQDLTQAFFERLLQKNYLAAADAERGGFRAFLITAFKHFLANEWTRARAQKRGGGSRTLSLDFSSADGLDTSPAAKESSPEQVYLRQWAVTLLDEVMTALQAEMERNGKALTFHLLKDYLVHRREVTYTDVASQLGVTEAAARMTTSRMRRRYGELLRAEISRTVAAPGDVDDEIRQLFAAFES